VGSATWFNDVNGQDGSATLSGEHRVNQISPAINYNSPVQGSSYFYILEGPTTPGACYGTSLHVSATSPNSISGGPQEGTWTSDTKCAPASAAPPDPPTPTPDPTAGSLDAGAYDPIVINLSGPYKLSGADDPVSFITNALGHPVTIGWTARNTDIAFLALDRNGDGQINNGWELFGNTTPLRQGGRASNGFEALAEYDANGDGVIDAADPVWNNLLLWVDANHDGASEPGELRRVADSSITAIEIQHHWTGRRDQSGNRFGYEGHLHEGKRVQSFYDVFFVRASQP